MSEIDPRYFLFDVIPANAAPFELRVNSPPFEAIVAEAFEVRIRNVLGSFAATVVSAPGGSSAAWSGQTFSCDLVGAYVLTVANGIAGPITFKVRAFPAEALTHSIVANRNHEALQQRSMIVAPDLRGPGERRVFLRAIAAGAFGAYDDATFAALTAQQPIPVGLMVR